MIVLPDVSTIRALIGALGSGEAHVREDGIKEPFALTRRRRLGRHDQRNQEESGSGYVGIAFGIVLLQKREKSALNIHGQFDEL